MNFYGYARGYENTKILENKMKWFAGQGLEPHKIFTDKPLHGDYPSDVLEKESAYYSLLLPRLKWGDTVFFHSFYDIGPLHRITQRLTTLRKKRVKVFINEAPLSLNISGRTLKSRELSPVLMSQIEAGNDYASYMLYQKAEEEKSALQFRTSEDRVPTSEEKEELIRFRALGFSIVELSRRFSLRKEIVKNIIFDAENGDTFTHIFRD